MVSSGSSTAKPRKPMVGDPAIRAQTPASAMLCLNIFQHKKKLSMNMPMTTTRLTRVRGRSLNSISRVALVMERNKAAGRAMSSTTLFRPCIWSLSNLCNLPPR